MSNHSYSTLNKLYYDYWQRPYNFFTGDRNILLYGMLGVTSVVLAYNTVLSPGGGGSTSLAAAVSATTESATPPPSSDATTAKENAPFRGGKTRRRRQRSTASHAKTR